MTADVVALSLGWMVALLLLPYNHERDWLRDGLLVIGGVAMGLLVIRANELYLSRIATVRTVEMSRLFRSMLILAVVSYLGFRAVRIPFSWREALLACVLSLVLLVVGRSVFRAWLTNARRQGSYLRDVVVVGTKGEGADLVDLMQCHPDLGFRVVGVAGERDEAERNGLGDLWLAPAENAASLVGPDGATGVVIAAGDLSHSVLNDLVRRLQLQHAHIHLSSGVRGIDYRRLRALPLAHEPLFYVEPSGLRRSQLAVKRVIDLIGAGHRPGGAVAAAPRAGPGGEDQRPRPGVLPPGAGRAQRPAVPLPQVPHDGRRRRGQAGRAAAHQRAHRPAVQDGPRPAASPASASSCATPASTSCPSCSTC